MHEKQTSSFALQRRRENLRNSRELEGSDIFHLPESKRGLASRLVAFTRLLNPMLGAKILKGAGFNIGIDEKKDRDNTPDD